MKLKIVAAKGIPVQKQTALDSGILLYLDVEVYTDAGQLIHHNDFVMQIPRFKRTYTGPELAEGEQPDPANFITERLTRTEVRAQAVVNIRGYVQRIKAALAENKPVRFDNRDPSLPATDEDPDGLIADVAGLLNIEIAE
jgi:hypothetical protein